MRPLPTSPDSLPKPRAEKPVAASNRVLELGSPSPASNHKRGGCPTQQAYPWLLGVSTVMAGIFCFLYINKPVIVTETTPAPKEVLAASTASTTGSQLARTSDDSTDKGEASSMAKVRPAEPQKLTGGGSAFEETNLRIQHVLGAQSTTGEDLGRVILEVPVLYQSGAVRWTQEDVAKARSLLSRIGAYQEKSRELREEAVVLISEWDALIVHSIPEGALRADSPTLPENQGIGAAEEATLNTTDSIEIETP